MGYLTITVRCPDRRMRQVMLVVVALVHLPVAGAAGAAVSPDALAMLRDCTRQMQNDERLACFDREVSALLHSSDLAGAAPVPAVLGPPASPESRFGMSSASVEHANNPTALAPERLPLLNSRVKLLKDLGYGRLLITLGNDQVWSQVTTAEHVDLKVGDLVVIRPALFGSYLLVDLSGHSTRVHRQR